MVSSFAADFVFGTSCVFVIWWFSGWAVWFFGFLRVYGPDGLRVVVFWWARLLCVAVTRWCGCVIWLCAVGLGVVVGDPGWCECWWFWLVSFGDLWRIWCCLIDCGRHCVVWWCFVGGCWVAWLVMFVFFVCSGFPVAFASCDLVRWCWAAGLVVLLGVFGFRCGFGILGLLLVCFALRRVFLVFSTLVVWCGGALRMADLVVCILVLPWGGFSWCLRFVWVV